MCRSGDGIFGDSGLRREEARYEIVLHVTARAARHDDTAGGDAAECAEVGLEPTDCRFVGYFDEIIEAAAADEARCDSQRFHQPVGWWSRGCGSRWEVELDPRVAAIGRQQATLRVETGLGR